MVTMLVVPILVLLVVHQKKLNSCSKYKKGPFGQ